MDLHQCPLDKRNCLEHIDITLSPTSLEYTIWNVFVTPRFLKETPSSEVHIAVLCLVYKQEQSLFINAIVIGLQQLTKASPIMLTYSCFPLLHQIALYDKALTEYVMCL